MATIISDLTPLVRQHIIEPTAVYWTDAELQGLMFRGIRDMWRSITDLKQDHFLTIDTTHVTFPASSTSLAGVPADVHKVYNIEPVDVTENSVNHGVVFMPRQYNDRFFQQARGMVPIDPTEATFYYSIHLQGGPIGPPDIRVAPKTTSTVNIAFSYVPVLGDLQASMKNPIPGESDNAIIAWTVAYARAKERVDRSPDPAWLTVYATEKQSLLQSLGIRQVQEPSYVGAEFEDYWS